MLSHVGIHVFTFTQHLRIIFLNLMILIHDQRRNLYSVKKKLLKLYKIVTDDMCILARSFI